MQLFGNHEDASFRAREGHEEEVYYLDQTPSWYCLECGQDVYIYNTSGLCELCQLQLDAEREELAHPKRTRR